MPDKRFRRRDCAAQKIFCIFILGFQDKSSAKRGVVFGRTQLCQSHVYRGKLFGIERFFVNPNTGGEQLDSFGKFGCKCKITNRLGDTDGKAEKTDDKKEKKQSVRISVCAVYKEKPSGGKQTADEKAAENDVKQSFSLTGKNLFAGKAKTFGKKAVRGGSFLFLFGVSDQLGKQGKIIGRKTMTGKNGKAVLRFYF